jgi:alpha-N-arabinofuranosidase
MDYVRELETEPYINVNFGTGTAAEVARWVEYVNGSTDTLEGSRRAEYRQEKPWGVRYWGIGNERNVKDAGDVLPRYRFPAHSATALVMNK